MAGLLAEVTAANEVDPRRRCGIGDFVAANLDDADRAELKQLEGDHTVKTAAIFAALQARGLGVRYDGFRRHRKGDCACGRTR